MAIWDDTRYNRDGQPVAPYTPPAPVDVESMLRNVTTLKGVLPFGSIDPRAVDHGGLVAALPLEPIDGQEARFLVSAAAGLVWTFVYHAAHAGPYKWFFVGGSPVHSPVVTLEATSSTTYADLATVGPTFPVPLPGVYAVAVSCGLVVNDASALSIGLMSPRIGSGTPLDADSVRGQMATVGTAFQSSPSRTWAAYLTATSAGDVISARYRVTNATATGSFFNRVLSVTPVRVGAA